MTSLDDFRSLDDSVARSYVIVRDGVHSINPPSLIVDDQQLRIKDIEDEITAVDDQQTTVEWRQRRNRYCDTSRPTVPAKPSSCALPPLSSSWIKDGAARAQSAVFHPKTDGARSSLSGGRLTLPAQVGDDHAELQFRFVGRDNLSGGTCSSPISSTLFQLPEYMPNGQKGSDMNGVVPYKLMPCDGQRLATPPSSGIFSIDGLFVSAANSPVAGEPGEAPLQQPAVTDSVELSTGQLPPPALQTTDNIGENVAEVFDDEEDEGKNTIT